MSLADRDTCYVVAEIGSNWLIFDQAKESITAAKQAGADCVKFQAFTHRALYGADYIAPHALPLEWLPRLKEKADAVGIDFACTAFSPELVAAVDPYVKWHKVASSDCAWPQLLEAVARTGKPVVISYGAHGLYDMVRSIETLRYFGAKSVTPLYCVAAYPANTVDLRVMSKMAETLGMPVGYSDHTTDVINAPLEASNRGAVLIEKHMTAYPDLDTPDRPHSLTPAQFRQMVSALRGADPVMGPVQDEQAMLLRHNRRLIATSDILPGTRLIYGENFGALRSLADDTRGLSAWAWGDVDGRTAAVHIEAGMPIGPGDFA